MIQHELFSEVSGDGPVDVEVRLLPPNRLADWSGRHPVLALVHVRREALLVRVEVRDHHR